jgi:hypothetical protein
MLGLAFESRQDQARGTLMLRPSARTEVIISSVTLTATIVGSLVTTVLMPCLLNSIQVLLDYHSDAVQFTRGKTMVSRQTQGSQPEFEYHALSGNVDMGRFVTIETVEEQPISAFDILDCWHEGFSATLSLSPDAGC